MFNKVTRNEMALAFMHERASVDIMFKLQSSFESAMFKSLTARIDKLEERIKLLENERK